MTNPSSDSTNTRHDDEASQEEAEEESVVLNLKLPPERGDRLRAIAQQLGMTPSMAAERAIDLVCDEVVTIQGDGRSTETLIQEYQARLDLLHSVEDADADRSDN